MKLKQTLVVTTLAAAPLAVFAQSSVTVYGRLDVSVDRTKSGSTSMWREVDNASRLGFRGVEDLGGGMKAHFGIESGFGADTGTPTDPFYRNSYVGLQHTGLGYLSIGRTDSANPAGSPIYTLVTTHLAPAIHDAGAPAIGTKVLNARNRFNNAINYRSPTFAGLTFRARGALNGEAVAAATVENQIKNYDASLNFASGGLGVAVGASKDKYDIATPANSFDRKWTVLAAYDFGSVKIYGTVGKDRFANVTAAARRTDVAYALLGVQGEFGPHELTFNSMARDVQSDRNGTLKKWQASYNYNLTKRTQVYALYDNEDPNSNVVNNTVKTFSVGIQHNF
jgi:predicted porin